MNVKAADFLRENTDTKITGNFGARRVNKTGPMASLGRDASLKKKSLAEENQSETSKDDDSLEISTEAKKAFAEAAAKRQQERMEEMYKEQAEAAKEAGKGFEDLAKIMEIARRISNGDKVPSSDEKRLMEFNSKLYQAAKSAAMLNANKKHREYESLYEEEEEEKKSRSAGSTDDGEDVSEILDSSTAVPSEEGSAVVAEEAGNVVAGETGN